MASSSGAISCGNDSVSNVEEDVPEVITDRDIPEYKGVPHHLWTMKCVTLHNSDDIALGEGIFTVSNPTWWLEARDHLETLMWQSRYQIVLSRMSSQTIGGTLCGRFQSPMSFITVSAFSTMKGVISLIVKDWTGVYDQDRVDEELPLVGCTFPYRKSLGRLTLYCHKNP